MFRDSSLPTHRCGDDAADSAEYRPGMRAIGRVDDRPSLLLIGGRTSAPSSPRSPVAWISG